VPPTSESHVATQGQGRKSSKVSASGGETGTAATPLAAAAPSAAPTDAGFTTPPTPYKTATSSPMAPADAIAKLQQAQVSYM
jgi:hypothetical protein